MSGAGNTRARLIPRDQVPAHVIARLAAEGVYDLDAWRALGRRRREIFGVTSNMVEQLDELARARR